MTSKLEKKDSLKVGLSVITASLILALILTEAVVRLVLPTNSPDTIRKYSLPYIPAVYARQLLEPVDAMVDVDTDKAWGLKPFDAVSDQRYFISEKGYRGPNFDPGKAADSVRIIILGGSAVFDTNSWDTETDVKKSWPHIVERHLIAKGFRNTEVINAGIPGHSSADSLGRLFTQLWLYEPDLVVVYHGWNDMKFWGKNPISPERPLITHIQPYDERNNPFVSYQGTLDRLLSHSQIYIKLRNRYYKWKIDTGAEGADSGNGGDNLRKAAYSRFGPEQFRLNLELIVSASNSIGAIPVLVTQATLVSSGNTDTDIAKIGFDYQDLTHEAIVHGFDETYDIVRRVGEKTDSLVIDAASAMNGNSEYFSDHVHTSTNGSARLAEIVADQLATVLDKITEKERH